MRDFILIAAVPDMPGNLNSLMSARQCEACPQFGEQFDTDSLSSEWSHVYGKAAKFDIYLNFFLVALAKESI